MATHGNHATGRLLAVLAGTAVAAVVSGLGGAARAAGPPPTSRPERPAENPALLALPENTWVHLRPARNPAGRSYTGICAGNGLIYYFGGGHGSYAGNDVELYDITANTWTQATEPEFWTDVDQWTHLSAAERKTVKGIGGGWGVGILSPKGRPLTQHTFQQHAWFPEERAFYNLMQAAGLWAFDPEKRQWTLVTRDAPKGSDIHSWNLVYDPDLKTVLSIMTAGQKGVHVFDREKKAFVTKYPLAMSGYHVYSTYDTARKVHVVFGCQKWWTLEMATGQVKPMADLAQARQATGAAPPHYEEGSLSLEYDPASGQVLALIKPRTGIELWAYDADKDAWSPVAMAGQRPKGSSDFDLLVYDPAHRCHLFLNVLGVSGYKGGRTDGLFAFRCAPPKPAPPAPEVPR